MYLKPTSKLSNTTHYLEQISNCSLITIIAAFFITFPFIMRYVIYKEQLEIKTNQM